MPVRLPKEEDNGKWQQWVQQVHVEMRQVSHAHQAMRKAANVCGFSRPVGATQTQQKLHQLVAKLRKRQKEKVEERAKAEGADCKEEVAQAKKRVQAARRAVEDEHGRIYQSVVAEHERFMERAVPNQSLRYIRVLAEGRQPQEIRAVRLQDGRVTGNTREVLAAVAESFQGQHNQAQRGLSETTRRMVQALPRVFTEEQIGAIHRRRVTLGEITEVVRPLKWKKEPSGGPAGRGGIPEPWCTRTGWVGGGGHRGAAHRQAPSGSGRHAEALIQEGG